MREVVIKIACDWCDSSLTEENVVEVSATVKYPDGTMEYTADSCVECALSRTGKMWENKRKRKSPAKPGTAGPHACDQCDKRFSKPAGLTRHKNQSHGWVA